MTSWDVFHAESLELERGLSSDAVRAAMAAGSLREDDLIRPAGATASWTRLGDHPELSSASGAESGTGEAPGRLRGGRAGAATAPVSDFEFRAEDSGAIPPIEAPTAPAAPTPPAWVQLGGEPDDVTFPVIPAAPEDRPGSAAAESGASPGADAPGAPAWNWPEDDADDDDGEIVDLDDRIEIVDHEAAGLEILDEDGLDVPGASSAGAYAGDGGSRLSLPVAPSRDWNEDRPPVEGAEEEDFTLARGGPMTVEELDLAPMVDVAFQLVLFFMVTATTVLYKTLEIPKPTTDQAPGAVAQGRSRSVEDLQKDYVLVEIDASGAMKIDREPVAATVEALAERLRAARDKTGRTIMLLSADYATAHRNAVLAYDAAIEIGMGIAIARPNPPRGPAPSVFPAAPGGPAPGPAPAGDGPSAGEKAAKRATPANSPEDGGPF